MATTKTLTRLFSLSLQQALRRNSSNLVHITRNCLHIHVQTQSFIPKQVFVSNAKIKRRYATLVENAEELRSSKEICWKCSEKVKTSEFFCASCGTVLPVKNSDSYFTLFNLQVDFDISSPLLQNKFKKLQKLLHPDKFSLKSSAEQEISESVSSKLNKAYFCLAKPLSRGLYMLKLQGIHLGENVSADDPEFLMEIMELNEQIAASNEETHKEIQATVKSHLEELTTKIAAEFRDNNLYAAKEHLIRFKYYSNIDEKLRELIPPS
ncbi:iron-sulfur cluster co-chaperone protein HscB-like isoform X1 [Ciona intestinalis]